ncbi:MAG: hypothetical protein KJ950_13960 [Proteobacteria bacterium]|nr:hypothetical protein [Pseudomonadota bacterium]MBU1686115.1 hypothetical protein [Pseudomonadota bacterium]
MDVYCEKCRKVIGKITDDKIPAKGATTKCPHCEARIVVKKPVPEKQHSPKVVVPADNRVVSRSSESNVAPHDLRPLAAEKKELRQPGQQKDSIPPVKKREQPSRPSLASSSDNASTFDCSFNISSIIKEAWQRTKGSKLAIWGGLICFIVILMVLGFFEGFLPDSASGPVGFIVVSVLENGLLAPLLAGILMIGVMKASDRKEGFTHMFHYYSNFKSLFIAGLIVYFLVNLAVLAILGRILNIAPEGLGASQTPAEVYVSFLVSLFSSLPSMIFFLLLGVLEIYFVLAYSLTLPLIAGRGVGPFVAMEMSRRGISRHFFKVFLLFLTFGFIAMLSTIPMGLGLIWTVPFGVMVIGVLCRTIYGEEAPGNTAGATVLGSVSLPDNSRSVWAVPLLAVVANIILAFGMFSFAEPMPVLAGNLGAIDSGSFVFHSVEGFTLTLPSDWEEIPPDVLESFSEQVSEGMEGGRDKMLYRHGFQRKGSDRWLACPYILVMLQGGATEEELKDVKRVKADMQAGIDEVQATSDNLMSDISQGEPLYDEDKKILWVSADIQNVEGIGPVKSLGAFKLTAKGNILFYGYSTAETYQELAPLFAKAFTNVTLDEQLVYKPQPAVKEKTSYPEWLVGTWEMTYDPDGSSNDQLEFSRGGIVLSTNASGVGLSGRYTVDSGRVELIFTKKGRSIRFEMSADPSQGKLLLDSKGTGNFTVYEKRGNRSESSAGVADVLPVISNIVNTEGMHVISGGLLQGGAPFYSDRKITLNYIPPKYQGLPYIRTACDLKKKGKSSTISFDVNVSVYVYVAWDERVPLVDWLTDNFTLTGDYLNHSGKQPRYQIYKSNVVWGPGQINIFGQEPSKYSYYLIFLETAS